MNRNRHWLLILFGCWVVLWHLVSWIGWSDLSAALKSSNFALRCLALPVIILSWPAHQICLALSGLGFGYNAKCPANAWSFIVFLLQALVTWVFVLVPIFQQKKVWPWLAAQLVLLLILFCTFWYYGQG